MHHEDAVQSTLAAMRDAGVGAIFEAAFLEDNVRIRADILARLPSERWHLIEVKSSTGVKDEYLTDVAVQYRVLQKAGIDLDRVYLMHINREYALGSEGLDLSRFMILEDLTEDAIQLQDVIQENLERLKTMLWMDTPPVVQPSRHCHQPHNFELWDHCTRDVPEHWIFELSGIRQERFEELAAKGVVAIDQIPDSFPVTAMQRRMRDCVIASEEYIGQRLGGALSDVEFPIHFLDFETIMPAVPRYTGTRPYQAIPFQWSDHILYADGNLEHRDFLFYEDVDPRKAFTQSLLDVLGSEGTIFIYTTYEQRILNELAEQLPQYADVLTRLHSRFVDLCALIKNNYYHAAFHGSFSLKSVLPALVPGMNYQNPAIQEGGMASFEYLRMIDPKTSAAEKNEIRKHLLAYCGLDTLAMVRIRDVLLAKTNIAVRS